MRTSREGIEKLCEWEGIEHEAYRDSAGKLTIGVGHLLTELEIRSENLILDGVPVDWRHGLTMDQIKELLAQDLVRFEDAVNSHVTVPLNQRQFDSLVSFAFNVGVHAFKTSTLLKRLNRRSYREVAPQLRRWNKSGGRVVAGLVNRREKEIEYCQWDEGRAA